MEMKYEMRDEGDQKMCQVWRVWEHLDALWCLLVYFHNFQNFVRFKNFQQQNVCQDILSNFDF